MYETQIRIPVSIRTLFFKPSSSYPVYLFCKQVNNTGIFYTLVDMDYEEEQRNEIEALESIYCNELQGKESHEYVGCWF